MSSDPESIPPLVSVIMSAYNSERTILESVNSILNQTLKNIELIVINDGSSDSTGKILQSKCNDPRLTVIDQVNKGLTKSLIYAASLSRGMYLARQDADDTSFPERLEKQFNYLEVNPSVALLGTQSVQIDDTGEELGKIELSLTHEAIYENIVTSNQFVHGSVMMRKEAYTKIGGYRSVFRFSQDYDLFLRIIEKYQVENMPDFLYKSRHNINMVSLTNKGEQMYYAECSRYLFGQRINGSVDQLDKNGNLPDIDVSTTAVKNHTVIYYQHLISSFLRKGNVSKVRKHAISLLKIRPLDVHTWAVLILTLFGSRAYIKVLSFIDSARSKK